MNSHKSVGACFAVTLFFLMAGCSAKNAATTFQNSSAPKVVDEKTARILGCNANEYTFAVVDNPNRKKAVTPNDLTILVGKEVIAKIELPKESEVKNFSLSSAEKTKAGFEIKVEWGGGLYHY